MSAFRYGQKQSKTGEQVKKYHIAHPHKTHRTACGYLFEERKWNIVSLFTSKKEEELCKKCVLIAGLKWRFKTVQGVGNE